MTQKVVVVGAGIVGVATAIWLRRFGAEVTLIDRDIPGSGTSFGNAGLLAAAAIVPVTGPGLIPKAPGMLLDRDYPLFLRWSYLPRLMPWLLRYLSHANDTDTRRIAAGLGPLNLDTVAQHIALTEGLTARRYVQPGTYSYAYESRDAYDAERYGWALRRAAGIVPEVLEGAAVQEAEPALGPGIGCLVRMSDHGHVLDSAGYVAALVQDFVAMGGVLRQAELLRIARSPEGRVTAALTDHGPLPCDRLVLTTGIWSGPLAAQLGLRVALESERGYHLMLHGAGGGPASPVMIASGKFVATPMEIGLRCAGIVEYGGLRAGPSAAPFAFLRRQIVTTFPRLHWQEASEWMGHSPVIADSLPMIGEIGASGIHVGFGHQHIGLTAGPKTGRILAGQIMGRPLNLDMAPYAPDRFSG